ncbi:cholecystokinin receptor-like [Glandiceps talaboti]
MASWDTNQSLSDDLLVFSDYPTNDSYDINNISYYSPPSPPPLQIWLPTVLVYGFTFIVGLTGNVLVIFAIQRCRRLQNVTNSFLASLATADLIIIVIVIPFQTPSYFSWRWELGGFMCKMLSYLTLLSSSCSVFMLTAMSVERYFVIVHPLLAKSVITLGRARRVIITVWVIAIIFSFPPLFYKRHFSWEFDNHPTHHSCRTVWPYKVLGKVYSIYLLLGMYLIPLFIMTYCYTRIIYELWVSTRRSKELQNRHVNQRRMYCRPISTSQSTIGMNGILDLPEHSKTATRQSSRPSLLVDEHKHMKLFRRGDADQGRKQVIVMLLVVVALFMICWGPLVWFVFLIEFEFVSRYSYTRTYLAITFNLLSYLNSCMNPICYAFISRTFRECFYWACRTCCRHTGFHGPRTPSISSRTIRSSLHSRSSLTRSSSTFRNSATTISSRQQSPIVENLPWNINDTANIHAPGVRDNGHIPGGESNV